MCQHSKALSRYFTLVENSREISRGEEFGEDGISGYLDRLFQVDDDIRDRNSMLLAHEDVEYVEIHYFVKNPVVIFDLIEKQVREKQYQLF